MLKKVLNSVLRIEYLLILISIFAFTSTLIFKNVGTKNLYSLEQQISVLILDYSTNAKDSKVFSNTEDFCNELQKNFLPLTYYNEAIENQLNFIVADLLNPNKKTTEEFIEECVTLQKLVQLNQNELNFGYESLLISSMFLLFIAIAVILYKYFIQKNELVKYQSLEVAQKKFSRDLHDGAAQDLAALKLYLQNNDKDKATFYAEHAFKEVRYLIDSTHIDLSAGFKETVKDTLSAFEKNFSIKTQFFCASSGIKKLTLETQIELLRILQEALSNTARHSGASLITIRLTDVVNVIHFTISDNGSGLENSIIEHQGKENTQNHYGLNNIKDRVEALGGTVDFITEGGTTIAITLQNPLH